jgi:diphthine-ammonia ligase
MRLVAIWSGGKDCYTACHKAIEQGHDVAFLLTFNYMDPYIFHSFLITELQAKALGIPQWVIKMPSQVIPHVYVDIQEPIARLKKEEGIEGIVTGDIDSTRHKPMWDKMVKELGMELITPLWDWPGHPYPGIRYRERVLDMELSTGMKAIINCIDQNYFGEEWLGREFNRACVQEMKAKVGPAGVGIDATGEFGEFHTTVLDSPLFKEAIEITKFSKKTLVTDHGGLPPTGNFLYMNIEEAVLKPKIAR